MEITNKKIIPIEVRDEYMLGSGVSIGARGSYDSVILKVKFDEKWQVLNKYATWTDALGNDVDQTLFTVLDLVDGEPDTYYIPVTAPVTKHAGTVKLSFTGYVVSGDSNKTVESLINTATGSFRVLESNATLLDDGSVNATLAQELYAAMNATVERLKDVEDGEADRDRQYAAREDTRDSEFNTKETARRTAFNNAQAERNSEFDDAQAQRQTAFNNAQAERQTAFNNAQAERQTAFNDAQTERQTAFTEEQNDRASAWNTEYASREAQLKNFVNGLGLAQAPGDSESQVMSQKATTKFVKDYVPKAASRNLANLTFERAFISSGEFIPLTSGNTNAAAPEYIEVESNTFYMFSCDPMTSVENAQMQVMMYDSSKTYITVQYWEMSSISNGAKIKTHANCNYLRIYVTTRASNSDWRALIPLRLQIEVGELKTDYIPPAVLDVLHASNVKIEQTYGNSETDVMSQKGTTDLAKMITKCVDETYSPGAPETVPYAGMVNSTGGMGLAGAWCGTNYIPVNESTIITSNEIYGTATIATVAFYDENKSFISCIACTEGTKFSINATPPEGAKYVRLTFLASQQSNWIRVVTWVKAVTEENFENKAGEFANNYIPKVASKNIANFSTFESAAISVEGYYHVNENQGEAASPDYISVESDRNYTVSWESVEADNPQLQIHCYTADKTYIKTEYVAMSGNSFRLKTDATCKYIRIAFNKSGVFWKDLIPNKFQIELGTEATEYTAPLVINPDYIERKTEFPYDKYGLPVLEFFGNTDYMNKDTAVTLDYKYGDREGTCTLKWQGSSSLSYPKKNYTVKFDTAFEAKEGWGEQKKYCLKANYIDFSHSRNICSAKLWGDVVKSRKPANATLNALPNAGAIDGFPICVVINGEYKGIYTFNIPKDGWMFGMGSGTNEAILCANGHDATSGSVALFHSLAECTDDLEIEYATDEDNTAWIKTSVNRLIQACIDCSSEADFDANVAPYLDVESAIDYYIFCLITQNLDGYSKNYLLSTYDGTKWFFSAYDLDSTFGLYVNGKKLMPNDGSGEGYGVCGVGTSSHQVFILIDKYKSAELKARYKDLVEGYNGAWGKPLSEDRVVDTFYNFAGSIPKALLDEEVKMWTALPSTSVNNVSQIIDHYRRRRAFIDPQIEAL